MLNYPLKLSFKLLALNPQVKVTDPTGQVVLYVKQKALALREDVKIFADEGQTQQLYQIKANRIIDFSARYEITRASGLPLGAIKRQGMRSIFKATYQVFDSVGNEVGLIHEENPWLRLLDALLSEIPFAGMLVNPAYLVDYRGAEVMYFKKQPSLMERQFLLENRAALSEAEEGLLLASVIMMMMLERQRG